jgi:hypothetical protein
MYESEVMVNHWSAFLTLTLIFNCQSVFAWCYSLYDIKTDTPRYKNYIPPIDISLQPPSAEYHNAVATGLRLQIDQGFSCFDGWIRPPEKNGLGKSAAKYTEPSSRSSSVDGQFSEKSRNDFYGRHTETEKAFRDAARKPNLD